MNNNLNSDWSVKDQNYINETLSEQKEDNSISELSVYAVYLKIGPRKILMLLKPRTREIIYTPSGINYLKLDKNKLPPYELITHLIARGRNFISVPYVKGRSEHEIDEIILSITNQTEYEIKDINTNEIPIYTGVYGNVIPVIKSLKSVTPCQKNQLISLCQSPKGTQLYNSFIQMSDSFDKMFSIGKMVLGNNGDYIVTCGDVGFEDILEDIRKCGKVYYLVNVTKDTVIIGGYVETSHALVIMIDPQIKILEVFDSNGISPDTKHVYFWVTKLEKYLTNNGIEVYHKITADEPFCPQLVSAFAPEFKGEQQCLIWAFWYIWLRVNNIMVPANAIRRYMAQMTPQEAFDKVQRVASMAFGSDGAIDITYAIYSKIGPRKILMLLKPFTREVIYTPYGIKFLKLDINNLPLYLESAVLYLDTPLRDNNQFVSLPYIKGRSERELERLISGI